MFHRILANRTLWSKLWLSLWIGVAVTVGWLGYSSADTAATRRPSPTSQAIETIAVGTHVLAENPTDEADHEFGVCVESEDWRKLTLLAQKADGTTADVVLLRPLWWLEAQRAQVGGQVELHAPECGIEGHARVLAIDACPPVTRPPPGYRTVTGTFRHHAAQICRVRAEQLDTTIACTPNHPFWSEDLQQFVRADELRPGETLRACDRTYQVASVEHSDQPETVFNLEVQVDHTYFVTSTGILVHNAKGDKCKLLASKVGRAIPGQPGVVTGGSSTKLGKNMMEAMGLRRSQKWKGYQAHHVIPSEVRSHPVIQKIGMELDHASNGMFLRVPKEGTTSVMSRHRGYHSVYNEVAERALNRMDVTKSVAQLEREVADLQRKLRFLQNQGVPLYPSQGATVELWERLLGAL